MSGVKIEYSGTSGASYTELKAKVSEALTKTNKTFQWTQAVAQGSMVTAAQMIELMDAADVAYNANSSGCSSNNSAVQSSYCNYGNYNRAVNNSQLATVCSSNDSTVKTSHLTAYNRSN